MKKDDDILDFEQLFRGTWNKVYHLCLKYCRDEDVAKDLTQNIYASLWQRKMQFPDLTSAEKYLAKAAKYQSIQYWRTLPPAAGTTLPEPEAESPEQLFLYKELARHAELAMDGVPEPSRTIFLLSRESEYTYQEIARERNISTKTVEFHISRVLRLLRSKLGT